MMTDDADIDRITKKTESVMDDIKELINIAAECPTCRKRCNRKMTKIDFSSGFIININGT
jgi:hypothetical protein